jgi:hypothetical protein
MDRVPTPSLGACFRSTNAGDHAENAFGIEPHMVITPGNGATRSSLSIVSMDRHFHGGGFRLLFLSLGYLSELATHHISQQDRPCYSGMSNSLVRVSILERPSTGGEALHQGK